MCVSFSQSGRQCHWSWSSGWCVFASWKTCWCCRLCCWCLLHQEQRGALQFSALLKHCWREAQVEKNKFRETSSCMSSFFTCHVSFLGFSSLHKCIQMHCIAVLSSVTPCFFFTSLHEFSVLMILTIVFP